MAKYQRLQQLENEASMYGYDLVRQYVILSPGGYVEETFSTLNEVDKWLTRKESLQMGFGGGDD